MEMKTKILDKKHIIIISISILAIIISLFNVSFAYFSDSKNEPISIKSVNTFGESTVYNTDVVLEGNLTYTTDKTNMLKNNNTLSFTKDNVENNDYLLTVATQVDPHTTEYEENEYTSISYEIYHKTDINLNTTSFTCVEGKYNDGDTCNTGTFIENSLNGLPFELIKDFRIKDTNTHYFDIYIYLNNDTDSKQLKTRIFYLDKEVEKEKDNNKSTPNPPDIDNTGLVPIKYNETTSKWVVTTQDDPEWYDYDNQKWANAASIKEGVITESNPYPELTVPDGTSTESDILAMFVWIPRYSYTIGCTDIDEDGIVNDILNGDFNECLGYKIDGASNLDNYEKIPGAIDIKFIGEEVTDDKITSEGIYPKYTYTTNEDRNPINWYTHPAFWWDEDDDGVREIGEELSGIWVGKFETSVNPDSECYNNIVDEDDNAENNCVASNIDVTPRILPNVLSLIYQNVYNQFETAKKFKTNSIYKLDNKSDSHMMKNRDWGAVAYLSQSIYGKYGNSSYSGVYKEIYKNNSGSENYWTRFTGRSIGTISISYDDFLEQGTCKYNEIGENRSEGIGLCGPGASTTGNVYGIYDMNGGADEHVMGYYTGLDSEFGSHIDRYTSAPKNDSGFTNLTKPLNKYFDGYELEIDKNNAEIAIQEIGSASKETREWNFDWFNNIDKEYPWIARGSVFYMAGDAGIFNLNGDSGYGNYNYSFRSVLTTVTN